jgi:hypothetical protein
MSSYKYRVGNSRMSKAARFDGADTTLQPVCTARSSTLVVGAANETGTGLFVLTGGRQLNVHAQPLITLGRYLPKHVPGLRIDFMQFKVSAAAIDEACWSSNSSISDQSVQPKNHYPKHNWRN